jgi:hypothetical protein
MRVGGGIVTSCCLAGQVWVPVLHFRDLAYIEQLVNYAVHCVSGWWWGAEVDKGGQGVNQCWDCAGR